MGTSVLPQRQENAGSAAVVARGGGPGWPRKCLSQGTASSGASTTAGKCRIRCRCGKGRRDGGPGCHEKCLSQGTASSGASATAGKCGFRCRCGKGRRTWVAQEVPLAGDGQFRGFRNGRKMQDPLPLWQGAEDRGNMERRYFMVIPPEGPPTAASPRLSTRRRGPPGHLQQILPQPRPMSPSARTGKAKSVSARGPG